MRTNPVIHDRFYAAPTPVLRLWCWLLTMSPSGYTGTSGDLHRLMRESGAVVSRKVLPRSLAMLQKAGMARVVRSGHHIEVAIVGNES